MALEFSGPSAINSPATGRNVDAVRTLLAEGRRPGAVETAVASAGAAEWVARAAMMFKAGAYDVAYQDYVKAISKDPANDAALTGFTRAAAAARKDPEGVAFLKATAAANPHLAGPRIELSKLLAANGSFDDGLKAAREAIAIQPLRPEALDQLASLFADAGEADALEPAAAQLQQQFPQRSTAAYYVAALHFLRGQLADALKSVDLSIERDATRASSHNLRGAVLANLGDTNRARQSFQRALELDPRDVNAYNNLGLLELSSGNVAVASNLFAEALTLDPTSPAAREGLARAQ
jgi:tetratricopeptide (TPR) repeat protein